MPPIVLRTAAIVMAASGRPMLRIEPASRQKWRYAAAGCGPGPGATRAPPMPPGRFFHGAPRPSIVCPPGPRWGPFCALRVRRLARCGCALRAASASARRARPLCAARLPPGFLRSATCAPRIAAPRALAGPVCPSLAVASLRAPLGVALVSSPARALVSACPRRVPPASCAARGSRPGGP